MLVKRPLSSLSYRYIAHNSKSKRIGPSITTTTIIYLSTTRNSNTMTTTSNYFNSALPLPIEHQCDAYQAAENSFNKTKSPPISLLSLEGQGLYAPSPDLLPAGADFLLEIHNRRQKSATPYKKMSRKEREYVDNAAGKQKLLKKPATTLQKMTKIERNLLLEKALTLISQPDISTPLRE
jgi:hypothetical protein